jgi:hypothetical protein
MFLAHKPAEGMIREFLLRQAHPGVFVQRGRGFGELGACGLHCRLPSGQAGNRPGSIPESDTGRWKLGDVSSRLGGALLAKRCYRSGDDSRGFGSSLVILVS